MKTPTTIRAKARQGKPGLPAKPPVFALRVVRALLPLWRETRRLGFGFLMVLALAVASSISAEPLPLRADSATDPTLHLEAMPFQVIGLEDDPAKQRALEDFAFRAWERLRERAGGRSWPGTALVVWSKSQTEFLQHTGKPPENVAAAASPRKMTLWINPAAWSRSTPEENLETMTHEMGHLLLGSLRTGGRLPMWAEEGLAMHLADQWSPLDTVQLAEARLFGALPNLRDLEKTFPDSGGAQQSLAYAVSYFAVERIARSYGDKPGRVDRLVDSLAHPERGEALVRELWDDFRREGWQMDVEQTLGTSLAAFVIVFSSGTLFWLIVIALAAAAFVKLRRRRDEVARREAEEEPWAESLTDADVQDIYGDRDERFEEPKAGSRTSRPWPEAEDR